MSICGLEEILPFRVTTTEKVQYNRRSFGPGWPAQSLTAKPIRQILMILQMSVNSGPPPAPPTPFARTLAQLAEGEPGILDRLDLPDDIARRLMELGFLPGHIIIPARSAPTGDPRVYRVDGSEVALRRETASHLYLRPSNGTSSVK
jgi:ferrous iron transport protein A